MQEKYKNLVRWEGWKKELPQILFLIGLLVACYGYYDLYTRYQELMDKPCVWSCFASEYITAFKSKNPGLSINCFYETKSCTITGFVDNSLRQFGQDTFNITGVLFEVNLSEENESG